VKCKRCRGPAVVEVRRHNAAFCQECFVRHVHELVRHAIRSHDMLAPGQRVLVCVSGGKDSLGLWDALLELGYDATGLYLGLGIGDYSDRSAEATRAFAREREARLIEVDLRGDYGFDVPTAGRRGSRSTCAVCGLSKRYVFNRAALENGFDVVATGHNLDDEAATLLGNTLRWQTEYIARQFPVLPQREGMVKKVKPLHRLSELETAAYAFLRGIDYVVEECPLVAGNTQLRYKEAMNALESRSPGTKAAFFLGFVEKGAPLFAGAGGSEAALSACERCGQPTTARFCAFCRARAQVLGERLGSPGGSRDEVARADGDRQVAGELADEVLPAEIYAAP
jgi:tRNA-5-methyluridine54 2-sulfurtransferase